MNKILDKFKSGVYVVTTSLDGKDYGMTVSWCMKVSKEPALIAISIGKNRKEYDKIKKSEMFAVNILGEEHLEIGRHFGVSTGENVNNFDGVEIERLETGSPILKDCVGALDCEIVKEVNVGDHILFIGKVINYAEREGESLVFNKEDFP